MTDCVLYARVSTKEQQEEGYSLDTQQKALHAFCEAQGLRPVKAFVAAESASKPGREVFAAMLVYLVANPQVRTVLAMRLDRLSRNWADNAALEQLGVRVRCVEGDIADSPEGLFAADVMSAQAVYYSRDLSRKVGKGMREKVAQGGWPHRAPLGYDNDRLARTLTVDADRAPLVRYAFERYATGLVSCADLASELFARGLRSRGGKKVGASAVHGMLSNPLYCGLLPYDGQLHRGAHEPIVPVGVFERVQAAFEPNRNGNKQHRHEFLLRDFLTCADCGCKITGQLTKGHVYYRCTHGKGKGACSEHTTVREEVLVPQIAEILRKIAIKPHHVAALLKQAEELDSDVHGESERQQDAMRRQLDEVTRRASVLTDKLLDGTVSDEVYREKQKVLSDDTNALKLQLAALEQAPLEVTPLVTALTAAAQGASVTFENASVEVAREVLALTLSNMELSNREVVSYQWKRPFEVLEMDSDGALQNSWWAM